MKWKTRISILACVTAVGGLTPVTAYAGSPEFARTAEEWERLRDNVLEYDELADLVHEYNVTVQNNQYEYNKFIKDYGKTRDDIAKEYRDLADTLESNKSGDDSAGALISDLQLDLQAKQLREQADNNVEDSLIYHLTYSQAEDNLVASAQSKYITYYKKQLELESAKEKKQSLENSYGQIEVKRQAGMATESDLLDAKEAILEQEKTISNLEMEVENNRQKLVVMLGWKGSDNPEIREIPEVDMAVLDAIDLEADKETALEHNYTLKINKQKLENAQDEDNKADLRKTIAANEKQIGSSVQGAWQSLQTARLSYEQAIADEQTEARNLTLAQQKWNAGMSTRYEVEQQQFRVSEKRRDIEIASMNLLEALETYGWNVGGLANAG